MKRLFSIFLIFLFLLIACPCFAAKGPYTTYYITQTASGDGTGVDQSNYMSVATHNGKASDFFAGDDTLYLCGSITTGVTPKSPGTSGHQLIYDGACPSNPGSINVVTGVGIYGGTLSYHTLQNVTVTSNATSRAIHYTSGTGIIINNCTATGYQGLYLDDHTSPTINNNTFTGTSETVEISACHIRAKTSATVTNNTAHATGSKAYGMTLHGGTIAPLFTSSNNTSDGGEYSCRYMYVSGMSVVSTDDTCSNASSTGLFITGSSVTGAVLELYGIIANNNTVAGIADTASTITYSRQIITKSATRRWEAASNGSIGLYITNTTSDAVISYGDVHDNASSGVRLYKSVNPRVHHLAIYNNMEDGISFGDSDANNAVRNATCYNNIIYNNGRDNSTSGDAFTSHAGCTGNRYFYNIVYNNWASCHAHVLDATAEIYNDTCYHNGKSTRTVTTGNKACLYQSGTGGWIVKNTICIDNYPYEVSFTSTAYAASSLDYNIYQHTIGQNGIADGNGWNVDGEVTPHDWTWYHTTSGYEANSSVADPLFIDSANNNFHLQSSSPARGAGVNVGLSRTNPPDIGAEPYQQYVPWKH